MRTAATTSPKPSWRWTRTASSSALRVTTIANMGGYLSTFGPNIPTNLYGPLLAGVYTTPAIYCEVKVVFTNTLPVDAYRGAGRPEATFVLERLVDVAAMEMGIDKADIRRQNMIPLDAVSVSDAGHDAVRQRRPGRLPRQGAGRGRLGRFRAAQSGLRRRGKFRGIGLCTYVEACGLAPSRIAIRLGVRGGLFESATVRVHPTGHVTVLMGTHNHGQGHETTFAQIVSEKLGIPADNVEIVFGDTDKVQFGLGTYGSRSLAVGGSALVEGEREGHRQGQEDRGAHAGGERYGYRVRGRSLFGRGDRPAEDLRRGRAVGPFPGRLSAGDSRAGPRGAGVLRPGELHFPGGAHIAEVEIDPETGTVSC